jgi:hypothetical protein
MGKAPKTPAAPDPYKTAAAEARVNRVTEFGPNGTIRYGHVDDRGNFAQGMPDKGQMAARRVEETPFQSNLRGLSETGALGLASKLFGGGIDLPARAQVGDTDDYRRMIYDKSAALLTEDFNRDMLRTEDRLQNRGIPIGSEAYAAGIRPVSDSQARALSGLALDSYMQGGQEQNRLYGLNSAARSNAINEYAAAFGGNQVNPSPLVSPGGTSPIPLSSLIGQQYQQQVAAAQQAAAARNSMFGSIIGAGGAILASSREWKVVLDPAADVAERIAAVPVHRWLYTEPSLADGVPHIGPMAEDFAAAFGVGDGKTIAVVDMLGVMFAAIGDLSRKVNDLTARLEAKHGAA